MHLPGTVGREGDRAERSRTLETTRELIQVKRLSGLTMRHRILFKAGPGVGASSSGVWGGGLSASSASAAPHNSVYLLTHSGVAAWLCSFCRYFVEHLLHACQTRPPWPSELRGFVFYEKPRRMGRCQGRRGPAPLSATPLVWTAPPSSAFRDCPRPTASNLQSSGPSTWLAGHPLLAAISLPLCIHGFDHVTRRTLPPLTLGSTTCFGQRDASKHDASRGLESAHVTGLSASLRRP